VSLLVSFYLIFRVYLALARLEQAITEVVRMIALEQLPAPINSIDEELRSSTRGPGRPGARADACLSDTAS
jgi:hypothetical protein